jgi:small-conductance mechanosensitive channel
LVIFFGLSFAIYYSTILNQYSPDINDIVDKVFLLITILLIAYIFTRVTNVLFAWYAERQEKKKKMSQHILYVFRGIFNAIVYLIAFFVFMALAGIDLTGLAIGGAATAIVIGFALQHVLSDFFSAFSIYFDKPFEIGDFIIVGDYAGTVTKIGMKSTRVELLQGEELVLSNKELTTSSIRNFKKMNKRRISFGFGVTYDTPLKKLQKIPNIIKSVIDPEKLEYVDKLDRVHFTEFGDFSLNFEIVYYLKTKDYVKYRDTQQEINFLIKEAFEKEGIEMAFPTQTIFLNK